MANIFDKITQKGMDIATGFAKSNKDLVESVVTMTPQGRSISWIKKGLIAGTVLLCIILLVISIAMFSSKSTSAGIYLLGASIALTGYTVWMYRFSHDNVKINKSGTKGQYEGGSVDLQNFESNDNVYVEFEPDQWS